MGNELTTKYEPQTDELFKAESKMSLLTNSDYNWDGAHAIRLWKICIFHLSSALFPGIQST